MRVLLTANALTGHLSPLVATARGLLAAGHDVRFGCPAGFADRVRSAGFGVLAGEESGDTGQVPPAPDLRDHERRLHWAVTRSWPADARGWAPSLLAQASRWRPQVIVAEPVEHAGRVVAAALDLPLVDHGWGFSLPDGWTSQGTATIGDLYELCGATPRPPAARVDLGAASVQPVDAAPVPRFRYVPWSHPGAEPPAPDGRPRVLVTLGTVDNPDAAGRIHAAAVAAVDCGAQVIVALGNPDRSSALEFPTGVALLPWIDVPAVAATCDLVVHHGGAGSSWSTLTVGKAAVCAPQMADQFRNAGLLEAAGAAVVVPAGAQDTAGFRTRIALALASEALPAAADRVAAENAALPHPEQLGEVLTALVR